MSNEATMLIMILGIIFSIGSLIVFLVIPKGKQVEIMIPVGETFELTCNPLDSKEYSLWVRYSVDWKLGGTSGYSLVFDLKIMVDGFVTYEKKLGIGRDTPESIDHVSGPQYFTKTKRGPDGYHKTATMVIYNMGPRSQNSEITITGKVIEGPNTSAGPTKLYIAR